jgi:C4-dicarboxylate transporter DctQ subunit
MKTAKKIAANFEGYLCGALVAVMSVVVFMQVVFRFVIKGSLPWSEELSRYLQVYITFFGTAYGIKMGAHLGIEAFTHILPKNGRKALNILVDIASMFVCVLIMKYSADVVASQMQTGQLSPAMRLPMWSIYIAIPVGMGFCVIRYGVLFVNSIRTFNKGKAEGALN